MNANTIPPGLHNADFMARRAAAPPRGAGQAHPPFATKALNAEAWDVEGHRGLHLVNVISHSWGAVPEGGGKRIWARLAPPR